MKMRLVNCALAFCFVMPGFIFAAPPARADDAKDCAPLTWGAITYGDFSNERATVMVPVTVSERGGVAPFQLDTGSSATYVYDTSISAKDTGRTLSTDIGIAASGWTPVRRNVRLKGEDAIDSSWGTLGVDLLGPGIEVDLKGGRLCPLTPDRAARFSNWEAMERSGSSPVIRVHDGKRDLRLLLDTGSSAFSVLSTRGRTDALGRGEKVRKFRVPSFNSYVTVVEMKPRGGFTAFGRPLATPFAYAFDNPLAGLMLDRGQIDGLIGLTPFAGGSLALDFAGGRIAFREG
jgi:hypothetical protein